MLRYVKSGMMLMSIAYIVLGLMLLIMPETSLLWICYAFGVVVLITGIVCLIQYARIRGTGFTAPFMLVGGVITAGLGLFTLAKPQVVATSWCSATATSWTASVPGPRNWPAPTCARR